MSKPLIERVAATIRRLRKTKNMSQEELAHDAGLDRTYISGVERGIRNITLGSLEQIIHALDVSNSDFLRALIRDVTVELSDKQKR